MKTHLTHQSQLQHIFENLLKRKVKIPEEEKIIRLYNRQWRDFNLILLHLLWCRVPIPSVCIRYNILPSNKRF